MSGSGGEAFFSLDGECLVPAPHASGPWAPDMLHGRVLGGLLARALERDHAGEDFRFARLTVDLFRNTRMVPVHAATSLVRDGRRIRVADATVFAAGTPVARASAVLLRCSGGPSETVPGTPPWDAPSPDELASAPIRTSGWMPPFDLWMLGDDGKPIEDWTVARRRRVWLRDKHDLIAGEPMSPLVRAAMAGDFASPLSNKGTHNLEYINADYTLTLSRLPLSEAIGLEATGHVSDDGIGVATCAVHDTAGPIGFCTATAITNTRRVD